MKFKLAALSMLCASAAQATTVFINEIHYDNAGSDVGEFVEIAAPAGTDLTDWSVVFYNGSATQRKPYATKTLSGVVTDVSGGYGFVEVTHSGIQNGAPDGIALVDAVGTVVQFLSYEGSFTAADGEGPAAGLTSIDIGVSENGGTAIGESLQLTGSGTTASDFTWASPASETPNAANNGQSFGDGVIVDTAPVINSITPANGDTNVALDANIQIDFSEPVAFTVANTINCTSDVAKAVTLSGDSNSYTVNPDQDFASADECSFTVSAADVTDLDGTADNLAEDVTISFSVIDTSATIDFVINEIHADPAADLPGDANGDGVRSFSDDEFVELVNTSGQATDISGWTLADGARLRHVFPSDSIVEPGCAVVVFGGGAPSGLFGGALVQTATSGTVGFNNGGDTITLSNGSIGIEVEYGSAAGNNQSITLNPDVTGDAFVQHSSLESSNGALYSPGTTIDGSFFSGCTVPDVAPTVIDVTPADLSTNVSIDTSIVVTFSEDVAISASPTLTCTVSGEVALGTELVGEVYTLTPAAELTDGESCALNMLASTVTDLDGSVDSLASDFTSLFTTAVELSCDTPAAFTLISEVQGSGSASTLVGQDVLVQAVVTAILPELNAFVVQEEDADADANPATSEGVLVSNEVNASVPSVGDLVIVSGTVTESFGRTQLNLLSDVTDCSSESAVTLPTAMSFSLPLTAETDFEALEGMRVSSAAPLVVTDHFSLGRFGRMTLSNGRLFEPNNVYAPGSSDNDDLIAANALNRVLLDDGSDDQNREIVPFPTGNLSASNTLRLGDTVSVLDGVLDFARGEYTVYATDALTFAATNPRTPAPSLAEGNLKVASLNVLNYFNNIDSGSSNCGPSGSSGCRGADDNGVDANGRTEFERQKLKTVAAIAAMDADIVGLMEVENNGFGAGSAIKDLVDGVNAVMGENTYAIVDPGSTVGTDAITVALIYKPTAVSLSGALLILNGDNSISDESGPLFDTSRNRPSLIQKFALVENGEELVISVNHLKSKGSSCGAGDDDDVTGQGSCNLTRTRAAQALTTFLTEQFDDTPTLIIGDLNAYAKEDPIQAILDAGYTDLANAFGGSEAYSYMFGGELGYLDHALASASLIDSVVDTTEWHINADEPVVLDYNFEFIFPTNIDNFYAPDVYRMSDHDPVLVSLQLDAAAVRGDWDGDGDVDYNDYRGLLRAIQRRQEVSMDFDINGDGRITTSDARALLSLCTRRRCAV